MAAGCAGSHAGAGAEGAHTAQFRGQDPAQRGKLPLCGPSWGEMVTGPFALRVAGPEPGKRLLASRPSLQGRPPQPQERAGPLIEPPPKHATLKGRPEEEQRALEVAAGAQEGIGP